MPLVAMGLTRLDHPRICTHLSRRIQLTTKVEQKASTLAVLQLQQTCILSHNRTIITFHSLSRHT